MDDEPIPDSVVPMNVATKRRKRRRAKAQILNKKAVRAHKRKTGRTGHIWAKKSAGKTSGFSHSHPNPPWQIRKEW